ncbi:MAG: aminodeoxychorismate lyase [Lachnospiraceae bacterium]
MVNSMKTATMISKFLGTIIQLLVLVMVLLVTYKAALSAYDFGYRVFGEPAVSEAPGRDVSFSITEDMTSEDIAEALEKAGLIRDVTIFSIQHKLSSYEETLEVGDYILNTSMTNEEIMIILSGLGDS